MLHNIKIPLDANVRFMASEGLFEDRAGCGCVAPSVALRGVAMDSFYTKKLFYKKNSIHRSICLPPAMHTKDTTFGSLINDHKLHKALYRALLAWET